MIARIVRVIRRIVLLPPIEEARDPMRIPSVRAAVERRDLASEALQKLAREMDVTTYELHKRREDIARTVRDPQ